MSAGGDVDPRVWRVNLKAHGKGPGNAGLPRLRGRPDVRASVDLAANLSVVPGLKPSQSSSEG